MHIRGFFLWNEKKLVRKHWQHFCASHGIISCISSLISFHSCQFVWYYVFCNRSPFFFCLDKEVPCQNAIQERYVHKHTVKAVTMVTVNKYLPATCPQVADYLSTNYIFRLSFSNFYLLFSKHLRDASQKNFLQVRSWYNLLNSSFEEAKLNKKIYQTQYFNEKW